MGFAIRVMRRRSKVSESALVNGSVHPSVAIQFHPVVCGCRDSALVPMEVRSLAHRGCVFVFACAWVCVCVLVGTEPRVSGKHCHSYINKPDSRDRHWVRRLLWGEGWKEGWMDGEREHCGGGNLVYWQMDFAHVRVCVLGGFALMAASWRWACACTCACIFAGPLSQFVLCGICVCR